MRILVVEDDGPLANVLIRCLREESYAVDHAIDGQEAEWMAFENPYDLIILDLMLPRKDGMEVLQSLRAGDVTAPILILTARDKVDHRVEGLDKGADDFLGTQGDVWDTQWDMFLALVGAIVSQSILGRLHDRQIAALQSRS